MVLPAIIFPVSGDNLLERLFSRFIRMIAIAIVIGYILTALKLYEGVSLFFVCIVAVIISRLPSNSRKESFSNMRTNLLVRLFDFLEDRFHPYQLFRQYLSQQRVVIKNKMRISKSPVQILQTVLLLSVLAYSAYLRFYDTLRHAAPSMSDAYVTLAWMKYIEGKMLFYDGIYPQGFYIFLSLLHELASNDALYVMKYTGPLDGVLITIGIYLFVTKVTGRKLPGIVSAFIYGVLGGVLPAGWDRQGSTLPQEFGLVFLLPAWYYANAFLQTHKKSYLWTTVAAIAVIGLVHTLVFAFVWLGLFCLVCAYLLLDYKKTIHSARYLIITGIVMSVLAAIPVPIAWLFGKRFHGASLEFLVGANQTIKIPILTAIDQIAVVGIVLFLFISLWKKKKAGLDLVMPLFIFFLGVLSFLMYVIIGPMSGNLLLAVRSSVLWSVVAAIGIGSGVEALLRIIPSKQSTPRLSGTIIALSLMVLAIMYYKPIPSLPYKMQYDAEINQYLRITNEFSSAGWTLVSHDEGYDLALGKGWHINLRDFLTWYDPQKAKLVRNVNGKEEPLITKELFIFNQKKLFVVDIIGLEKMMDQRLKDYEELELWIVKYKEYHNDLSVYYEDSDIIIYHLRDLKI